MANHHVYYNIENCGRQWIALVHPYFSTEVCTVVPSRPRHHTQPRPIQLEELKGRGTHAITLQYTQAPGPVQRIISLLQVQEDRVEDLLHQGFNLLKQLELKGGGPCTATCPESMEEVLVSDVDGEVAIDNHCYRLLNHLHKAYAAVLPSPFRDQDHYFSGRLLW